MIFTRLDSLYIILPLLLVFTFLKWRRRKSYLSLSMLPYLRNRIRPVSRFVYLPKVLEFFALLVWRSRFSIPFSLRPSALSSTKGSTFF